MNDRYWTIRPGSIDDKPLLEQILEVTVFWQHNSPVATLESLEVYPILVRYVESWGRAGDAAIVAMEGDRAVGAAWYRHFSADAPGFGFVAADVPELAIGIIDGHRGAGLGQTMLDTLLERARQDGVRAISLSVEIANNRAVNLYRRTGFEVIEGDEGNYTMLLDLNREQR